MDLDEIDFSPADIAELSEPYGPRHAASAFKLGFCMGLSDQGLTPSEFEALAKLGGDAFGTGGWIPHLFGAYGETALMLGGAGAAAGAYSGYARARADQMLAGTDDPGIVALRKKIEAYHNMKQDLVRTNAIQPHPAQL